MPKNLQGFIHRVPVFLVPETFFADLLFEVLCLSRHSSVAECYVGVVATQLMDASPEVGHAWSWETGFLERFAQWAPDPYINGVMGPL